jgi:hypothetical protein
MIFSTEEYMGFLVERPESSRLFKSRSEDVCYITLTYLQQQSRSQETQIM